MGSALSLSISFCNSFAWFILGLFWRFSQAGRVASGEKLDKSAADWKNASKALGYQINSGRFMSGYIWLIFVILMLAVIAGITYSVIQCRKSDTDDKINEPTLPGIVAEVIENAENAEAN